MESLLTHRQGRRTWGWLLRQKLYQGPLHGGTEKGGHHPEAAQPGVEHLPSVLGVPGCAHSFLGRPSLEELLTTGSGVHACRPQRAVQRSRSEVAVWLEDPGRPAAHPRSRCVTVIRAAAGKPPLGPFLGHPAFC